MQELIKELRERTGAGFVDCKKALEATNNDINAAIEWLQKNGAAKAIKKAGNIAAEGVVNIVQNNQVAIVYEVNAQTDFVAKNDDFKKLVQEIGTVLLTNNFDENTNLNQLKDQNGKTIEELTINATAIIGEKISLRRAQKVSLSSGNKVGTYVHFDGRKATLFEATGGSDELLKGIAMHITAMNPEYLNQAAVPAEHIKKLEEEFAQSPALKGKPDNIKANILSGMLRKALSENVLMEQDYVVESGKTVGQLLKETNAEALRMYRFEVGEGIEKANVDFAAEVAAQMKK